MGFGKFLKVIEIDNGFFQDLGSLEKKGFSKWL